MNNTHFFYRVLTIIIVTIIVLLGMFKEKIIFFINDTLLIKYSDFDLAFLSNFIDSYGSGKSLTEWLAHYIVFYTFYLCCHFLLINLIFKSKPLIRKWVNWALISLLVILILGKIIFGVLNVRILEEYFSFAFHKLIALPFLLLAIEGGRSIYRIIDEGSN